MLSDRDKLSKSELIADLNVLFSYVCIVPYIFTKINYKTVTIRLQFGYKLLQKVTKSRKLLI